MKNRLLTLSNSSYRPVLKKL